MWLHFPAQQRLGLANNLLTGERFVKSIITTIMNDITDKLSKIKKYEAMEYVAGIKIVDIEKASWSRDREEDR